MKLAGFTIAVIGTLFASQVFAGKLDLPSVARATAKYIDPDAALADGYIPLPGAGCLTAEAVGADPSLGAVGTLFVHPDRLNLYSVGGRIVTNRAWTNWVNPGALIYEPRMDGGLALVGVANLVSPQGWAGNGFITEPITEGHVWSLVQDDPATAVDEAYGLAPHFTMRIWLFRKNSAGDYADFNTAVGCDPEENGIN